MSELGEENKELKQVKVANYIASMCVKADKYDRALSFFTKAQRLWADFTASELAKEASPLFSRLPAIPYTHLQFNFGNYYMQFRQAMEAATLFYNCLETSPYRYCG